MFRLFNSASRVLSIKDCMEVFSKGIHRALVPVDSHMDNISGVELVESASSYRMLTQMDVLRFVKEHAEASNELNGILSRTVAELGAVTERVYAITDRTKVIDAIKCMRIALLNAVPIISSSPANEDDHKQLVNVCISIFELLSYCLCKKFRHASPKLGFVVLMYRKNCLYHFHEVSMKYEQLFSLFLPVS